MRKLFRLAVAGASFWALGGSGFASQPTLAPRPPVARVGRTLLLPVTDGTGIRFNRLSTRDGLSQTRVLQIVQDDRGFMWFGTQYGLNRYDGYRFKLFKHVREEPNSLSSVYIYSLFKDREGSLWVGGEEFLDRFEPLTESFEHFPAAAAPIVHMSQDRTGLMWLSSRAGLVRFDPGSGETIHYRHDPEDRSSLSSDDAKFTGEDSSGTLWVASGNELQAFDRDSGKVSRRVLLGEPVRELAFHEDRFGVFWVFYNPSGGEGGLAVLEREPNTLVRYGFEGAAPDTALTGVYDMVETRDGVLWLATMGDGLLRLDRDRRGFVRYRNDPLDPESLAEDRAIALFEDRESNIWVGLHAREPNYFTADAPLFASVTPERDDPDGLGESIVNGIYVDRRGVLWVGTSGALSRLDRATGMRRFFRSPGPGVSNDVLTIAEDETGSLWVGTLTGLHRFDPNLGWLETYRHDPQSPSSLSNDIVTRVHVGRDGTIWVATFGGLNRFDPTTGRFTLSAAGSFHALAEDSRGELWLGSSTSGLHRLDPATGRLTVYRHEERKKSTLADNRVNSILVSREGVVWVGTQNGLSRLDRRTDGFTTYDEHDGLPTNAVSCVLEDRGGNLWMSTNRGLSRFDVAARSFRSYSTADGLPGEDLTGWGTCHQSRDGEMFFGGFGGATAFYPERIVEREYVPPTVLTDFRLSGELVPVEEGSLLETSITYASQVTLSPRENIFSLEFAALGYRSPATHRYRYRLDGLQTEWNEVGADGRVVSYTTLPSGAYTFRVQGATSRGAWDEPGASLVIDVLPPWWRGGWFLVSSIAAVVLALRCFYVHRVGRLARRLNERMEERLGERTRIARELHDTLLQGFISASMQLHVAMEALPRDSAGKAEVARILKLMGRVIEEGRNAVRGLRSTDPSTLSLEEFFSELRKERSGEGAVDYRVVVEGRSRPLSPGVRDEVYRIGREAVVNAFRHAGAAHIEVALEYRRSSLRLSVRDDGRGIDPAIIDAGSAGHWGLSGMRERAEAMGARLKVLTRAAAGTEVELVVPGNLAFASGPGRERPPGSRADR